MHIIKTDKYKLEIDLNKKNCNDLVKLLPLWKIVAKNNHEFEISQSMKSTRQQISFTDRNTPEITPLLLNE